jgi:hypothetical protein
MGDLIERKEALEAIKKYGKDAMSAGRRTLDPVDDTIELCNMVEQLPAALHRAEPEMRPLTLDEIYAKIDDEDWNVVWIEGPDSQKAEPMCPYYKEENKIVFCAPPFVRVWEETISRYGKSWRCWPRKPSPEQMAAAEWEE